MAGIRDLLPLMILQQLGRQKLGRTPEPASVTAQAENVAQYDQVMTTALVVAYAAGLQVVHRARTSEGGCAVDLACGPGHYTLCLARYLGYDAVTGIDLSPGMVATAQQNAAERGLANVVSFEQGDVTSLEIPAESVHLASFTDAAHHMPDLATVANVLAEMDRVTKADGLVMLMDVTRLRTEKLTERYVQLLGRDYKARGLPNFFEDFRNSMYAAWTVQELREAIPRDSNRLWCHLVPRGLPTTQIILGLPGGRQRVFVRGGVPWTERNCPVPKGMRFEWLAVRSTLALASRRLIRPTAAQDRAR